MVSPEIWKDGHHFNQFAALSASQCPVFSFHNLQHWKWKVVQKPYTQSGLDETCVESECMFFWCPSDSGPTKSRVGWKKLGVSWSSNYTRSQGVRCYRVPWRLGVASRCLASPRKLAGHPMLLQVSCSISWRSPLCVSQLGKHGWTWVQMAPGRVHFTWFCFPQFARTTAMQFSFSKQTVFKHIRLFILKFDVEHIRTKMSLCWYLDIGFCDGNM